MASGVEKGDCDRGSSIAPAEGLAKANRGDHASRLSQQRATRVDAGERNARGGAEDDIVATESTDFAIQIKGEDAGQAQRSGEAMAREKKECFTSS